MNNALVSLDSYLILLYSLSGDALMAFFLGTFVLALLCTAIGEVSIAVVFRINRDHINGLNNQLTERHNLSLEAARRGDNRVYMAANSLANDSFGKVFFNMITLSAALLWPVFFALAWMQSRFIDLEFPLPFRVPLLGNSVGYVFIFLLMYTVSRILFRYFKINLHYVRKLQKVLLQE